MDEMWEANCRVIREVLKKAGLSGSDIRCAAVCGHGKGLYLWGTDGRPARNGIISTDNRAWRYPLEWERNGTAQWVFQRSCQHILSSQPVSLLAWLGEHEPDVLENTRWIFACKDYVRFRLTGEAFAERTDYSGCNADFPNARTSCRRFAIPRISAAVSRKRLRKKPDFPRGRLWLAALSTSTPARWAWDSPIQGASV